MCLTVGVCFAPRLGKTVSETPHAQPQKTVRTKTWFPSHPNSLTYPAFCDRPQRYPTMPPNTTVQDNAMPNFLTMDLDTVTIRLEETKVKTYKASLSAVSPYFKNAFSGRFVEADEYSVFLGASVSKHSESSSTGCKRKACNITLLQLPSHITRYYHQTRSPD